MSLGKKIEVEPLSDARWSKIERGLFEQLDKEEGRAAPLVVEDEASPPRSKKRAAFYTLFAAAAIVAIVVGFKLGYNAPVAANPSRIVTGGSDSHLALGESSLDVGPESTLVVSGDDDHGVLIVLDRGKVTCEVAPRKGRPAFVVQAGGVRVRVIGTRFTVARDGDSARVDVARGVVEVSSGGKTTILRDGETWPSSTTAAIVPTPAPTQTPSAAPAPPATVSADDPIVIRANPKRPAPPAPTGAPVTTFPTNDAPPSATAPPPPPDPGPTPQQLFEQASKLEARDPGRAIAIYRQLAGSGGAWAMNALFAQGRLEADRGNRGEARRLLNEYLARYPRGPNAGDARALLERIK